MDRKIWHLSWLSLLVLLFVGACTTVASAATATLIPPTATAVPPTPTLEPPQDPQQQIGQALDVAHRQGIVHRDIKPANVLLDDEDNAYLADFGIAKNLEKANGHSLTEGGVLIGSPAYISPEQILSEPVKPQSDIYCLGIMLYEMLTGHKPFARPTPIAYIQQHLNEQLPSLQAHNPTLPFELDAVIQRAKARNPANRFADIPSLLVALQQALASVQGFASVNALQPAPAHCFCAAAAA